MQLRFNELDKIQDKCIVHADLSKTNMILNPNGQITPIDFSLSGYSHYYMDLGGLFGHIYSDVERKYILEGYKSVCQREINPYNIEPYFALQVILFIACQYERAKGWDWFADTMERWCRDIFKPLVNKTAFLLV